MRVTRRAALAMLSAAPAFGLARRVRAAREVTIMMILWRGETGTEKGFRDQLREEGIDASFIVRDAGQDVRRVAEFAAEAKARRPDLIYVWGTPATLALVGRRGEIDPARHVTDLPVVFAMVSSPVGSKLVDASRLSGRNLTGTSHVVPVPDQLRAMRAYRAFTRLAVLYNPTEANSVINVAELREQARLLSFTLIEEPVPLAGGKPDASDLGAVVARLMPRDPHFLYLGPDSFIGANSPAITGAALDLGLPTFSATEAPLRSASALFGLVSRYDNVGRLTAHKAARILRDGLAPGAIPVETLARFSLVVRMDVARRLSFYPPISLLDFAELVG
ncbi:MAG: ABC transporter substrate-binding protein [Rhodospirillales bacterium]|nr:ABC transporter substrate-binding protein [Rhodospirillales bacterium]